TSRCTTPLRCAASRADAAWPIHVNASSTGGAPLRSRSSSEPPLRNSITMNGRPCHSPTSKIVTVPGSPESLAAARASRVNLGPLGEPLDRARPPEQVVLGAQDLAHAAVADPRGFAIPGRQNVVRRAHQGPRPFHSRDANVRNLSIAGPF